MLRSARKNCCFIYKSNEKSGLFLDALHEPNIIKVTTILVLHVPVIQPPPSMIPIVRAKRTASKWPQVARL